MNNLETINNDILPLSAHITELIEAANFTIIANEDQENAAINETKNIKQLAKEIKAKKDFYIKPAEGYVKSIKDIFKPIENKLSEVETIYKNKLLEWRRKVEAEIKRIEDEKRAAQAEALKRQKEKEAAGEKIENPVIEKEINLKPEKSSRTGTATASYKIIKKLKIIDAEKIPRAYMVPDTVKIKNALLGGVMVPGCEIVEEKTISIL